ncbi:zinc finger protein 14 homolog [Rhineura floridana]|uniref:zinc finger protein 14 homolog n=1 Tax=Rhineura floridana TaxID=261503 RepID=UPI002AC8599A|nr:zinc finger protein 14 homolog [Rhineura floridana]XP_061478153.1 zinc finger protein 14 homolog [Rhineura floridana]XP_061478154.1 zinc finger protein 14 homolog [Rhineura floridana]XP_061478155.1 zinc finger protein 14 homolog [Rhineura floridana]
MQPAQSPVTFEEVSLHFSEDEWALLDPGQRALYKEVMADVHEMITSLAMSLEAWQPDVTAPEHEAAVDPRRTVDPAVQNPTATLSPAVRLAELRRKKPKGARSETFLVPILEKVKEYTCRKETAAATEHEQLMSLMKENNEVFRESIAAMKKHAEHNMRESNMYLDTMNGIVSAINASVSHLETLTRCFLEQNNSAASVATVSGMGGTRRKKTKSFLLL